jgi:hypothetical protein
MKESFYLKVKLIFYRNTGSWHSPLKMVGFKRGQADLYMPHDFIRYVAEVRNVSVDAIKVPERLVFTYQRRRLNMRKASSMEKC